MSRYLALLGRRWPLVVGAMLAGMLLAGLVASAQTPLYESRIQMFVSTSVSDGDSAYQGELFVRQRVPTYTETLTSSGFARALRDALGHRDSAAVLQGKIRASAPEDTVVIDAAVRDPSPEGARRIADGIADVFPTYIARLEVTGDEASPVRVSVTRRAELPTSPAAPSKRFYVVMGGALGLLIGVGLTVAGINFDDRLRTRTDVERAVDAPVIGSIPRRTLHASQRRDSGRRGPVVAAASASAIEHEPPPIATAVAAESAELEAYRRIRAALRGADGRLLARSLMITSPARAQGKTVAAANLAFAFAHAGYRVVLVDADLRTAGLTQLLGWGRADGLSDVLRGAMSLESATHADPYAVQLDFVAAGRPVPDASELLASPLLPGVFGALGERAGLVIVDTPPVPGLADALILAQAVSASLLVTRLHATRADQLSSTAQALRSVGSVVIGTVIARSPAASRRRVTTPGGFRPHSLLTWPERDGIAGSTS